MPKTKLALPVAARNQLEKALNQIGQAGLEQVPKTKEKQLKDQKLTHTPTHVNNLPPIEDKRLVLILDRWQTLPEHVRDAITSLARL